MKNEQKVVSGYLEVLPRGFGFLRDVSNGFQPSKQDIFVNGNLVSRYELRQGSLVKGHLGKKAKKAKSDQLGKIISVDGQPIEEYKELPEFGDLTSISPTERIRIDATQDPDLRVVDLIAPIGKGQRALVVAPPRTGKTVLLQKLARVINSEHPEISLIIALIDERPEEVTEMQRLDCGEVIHSSSDMSPERHVKVAEMILHRSRRLVESGQDVVVLLDSITRLARAYNSTQKGSSRTLSGGLGADVLGKPREFFGAARKAEEAGSLTIVATALIDTGSRMDDVIFEEFKGTGNMELVLHRDLVDQRIWPAIDITSSGTRREELLRDSETQQSINLMRRALSKLSPDKAMQTLLKKIHDTPDNETFLKSLAKKI